MQVHRRRSRQEETGIRWGGWAVSSNGKPTDQNYSHRVEAPAEGLTTVDEIATVQFNKPFNRGRKAARTESLIHLEAHIFFPSGCLSYERINQHQVV
ncbi:hypothetical protein NDU88_006661 [Pleurodeles waltl]|uniref:Uncharacterized protein n=1 Tax=Pleurodeles waltl TaxID=8319 RepID=A0AAV7N201_PLEWA|nr:hypothetical protein NDU88_006661 [Pleurodeles waltl]